MGGSTKRKQKAKQKPKQQSKSKPSAALKSENKGRFRYVSLQDELQARGLRITTVAADGNCFFRAVSDQLTGSEKDHGKIRENVVQYMESHADEFSPFVEDDEGFEKYLIRMRKNSTWAGHMEVQATSMCYERNIRIYQQGQPIWRVVNFQPAETSPCLYLSYHDGEHYNSVRLQSDSGKGPAEPILLEGSRCDDAGEDIGAVFGERDVRRVAESTNCFDLECVKDALASCGNVDDAIERVIERMRGRHSNGDASKNGALHPEKGSADPADSLRQGAQAVGAGLEAAHVRVSFRITNRKKVKVKFVVEVLGSSCTRQASDEGCRELHADTACNTSKCCSEQDANAVDAIATGEAMVEKLVKTPLTKAEARAAKNKKCGCGSGRKFKNCCGKAGKVIAARSPSSSKDVIAPVTPSRLSSIDI